jgi:hypothetical protein
MVNLAIGVLRWVFLAQELRKEQLVDHLDPGLGV